MTLDGETITFDFTGTDEQRWAPMNCNLTQTFTACVYVLKCLVDPDIPVNEGFYQPIRVIAPEGLAVNPRHPGAIVGGWEVSTRLCEVLFEALSPAIPEAVPAGTKGMICQVGFGGEDPSTGEYYSYYETVAGGYGGRSGVGRSRRRADSHSEYPERPHRGDGAQLPGSHYPLQPDP